MKLFNKSLFNRNFYTWFVPILIFLSLISCSNSKKSVEENFDIWDIIKNINLSSEKIKSLKGNGNISLTSENGGNSGNFKINLLKPDSISLNITGPFGISVVKALITRDTFFFHDSFNNVVVTGKTTKKNIEQIFRLKIDFNDIIYVLSCSPNFLRETDLKPLVDLHKIDNEAILIYKNNGDIVKYYINLENKYISKRVVYSGSGKIISEEHYQSYYKKDNIWIPRSIKIVLPLENQSLSLYFEKQDINTNDLNFTFTFPKDTKVLQWRDN